MDPEEGIAPVDWEGCSRGDILGWASRSSDAGILDGLNMVNPTSAIVIKLLIDQNLKP